MFQYIIQTIAFQLFFLMVYDIFLKKETFFNWNRAYLLGTSIVSLFIPLIKIERFKGAVAPEYIITLPEVFLGDAQKLQDNEAILNSNTTFQNAFSAWEVVFIIGALLAALWFSFKLIKVLKLLNLNPRHEIENLNIIKVLNSNVAFSFFKYVFLGELIHKDDKEAILKHEMVHVKQYHSVDLLVFEILRILFWFNPLIYMYQNRMVTLHEFIADAQSVDVKNKKAYYESLLSQIFETKKISFINPFFKQSLIKKRIVMLTKSKSKQINLLKYALLIPLVLGMLVYSSCQSEGDNEVSDNLDLSQYSHTSSLGKKMGKEARVIHENYEAFLKANSTNYVGWCEIDQENKVIKYSVHPIDEKRPEEFNKEPSILNFQDELTYKVYFSFKRVEETEAMKKERAENLKKLSEQYKDSSQVPFAFIKQVPLFSDCEDVSPEEQRKCMSMNISKHINRNFNTEIATELGLKGRQRMNVIFKIDKEGNIIGVRSRAPHPALQEEAIRVINTLPKMIPGKHNGKVVNVLYSLPIVFQVVE